MNFRTRDKNLSVFEIFRKNEDPSYPDLLVKFLDSPDPL